MNIRTAKRGDALEFLPLLEQLGYSTLDLSAVEKKIDEYIGPDYHLLICEDEGKVEGFIALHTFEIFHSPGRAGRITAFCINENSRGKGLGISLLREAEKFFSEQGCTMVEVTSNNRRTKTHDFYLRRGYTNSSLKFIKSLM